MQVNTSELLKFANNFADQSRLILRKKFLSSFNVEKKIDGSFVTNVDREVESLFIKKLQDDFNEHGLIGEEFGELNSDAEYIWVIDPLDGTHSFISGKPLFGTLISCLKDSKPILGLIDIPMLNQRWVGAENLGVYFNNTKCSKNIVEKKFSETIVTSTSMLMFDEKSLEKVKKIYSSSQFPVFGTDCYAYGLLISGKIDLIVEANMKPWDYLAQVALINEVGGFISDWNGEDLNLNSNGKVIASMDRNHHKKLINILS